MTSEEGSEAARPESEEARPEEAPPPAPPSARASIRRTLLQALPLAVVAAFVTLLCINALARGVARPEPWVTLLLVAVLLVHIVASLALHGGFFRDVLALDREREKAVPDPGVLERGFGRIVNAPRFWCIRSFAWFVLGGINLTLLRHWIDPEAFPLVHVAVRGVGALSGAFLYSALLFFLLKREFAPLRASLASEFGAAELARRFVRPVPVRLKVVVGVTGALLVATLYGTVLAQVRADRTAEATAVTIGGRLLERLDRVDVAQAQELGLLDRVVFADPGRDPSLTGLADSLSGFEVAFILEQGLATGDSLALDSPRHFAWRTLPDGRLAVSLAASELFGARVPAMKGALGVFLCVVLVVTIAVAWLLASDIERAVRALSGEVGRLASGDLGRGESLVWEDELGDLAARLDHMAESLGAMIVRVRGTADRVDGAAGGISEANANLMQTIQEQVNGAEMLRTALLGVTGQVQGISASARELTTSVEEGSQSILAMRTSGQSLDQDASLLNEKVDEVSSSIEELIRSVRDVLENVETLSGASVDTSSSMEQMAASLREVDTNAVETARLSQDVVERAEDGREKVRETLKGMENIRTATQSARVVIHELGGRTKQIGAIVNVIDDVAEETNLLALNAAIIAAQAGENGRAFSVVADEIKKLADRVLSSTKEIEQVIRSVQDETVNAVGAIEAGSREVETGVHQAEEAGEALDAITASARDSGSRIGEIVTAVNEQTRAAGHVVALMERVRSGVEQIRRAGQEQDRGNESMLATTEVMREIARRVRNTTGEQAEGSLGLAEGVDAVREAVQQITAALSEQSMSCGAAESELREMQERTKVNDEVARDLDGAVDRMRGDAERLREAVGRFRV
ncbi:MAG: hypothetical protein HKP30_09205 [Myxococcales bacterium]|nr:hypothetical protein [Myxococcales bacterium]